MFTYQPSVDMSDSNINDVIVIKDSADDTIALPLHQPGAINIIKLLGTTITMYQKGTNGIFVLGK